MGSLMLSTINDFFGDYLRYNRISNFELIILGKDIVTQDEVNNDGVISYKSMYEHVSFCKDISPPSYVEQYAYGLNNREFIETYTRHLSTQPAMMNLCCIVDLVVNRDVNVIMLCSEREFKMGFVEPLREFIFNNFGLYFITSVEYKYDPELLAKFGDIPDIRRKLKYQIEEFQFVDEFIGTFLNKFIDNIEESYREILMSKSIDELYNYAKKYSIYVNKYKPKEYTVDRILSKVLS